MNKTKFIVLLISLVAGLSKIHGQDTLLVDPIKIDSLKQVIERSSKENEHKVILLNEYARLCFYAEQYLPAYTATQKAREITEDLNFEGGRILYFLSLATFFTDSYNNSMRSYYQRRAQSLASKADEKDSKYYKELENYSVVTDKSSEKKITDLIPILKDFNSPGDRELKAAILIRIRNVYYKPATVNRALNFNDSILNIFQDLDLTYPVFYFMSDKMTILNYKGDVNAVRQLEKQLVEMVTLKKDDNSIGLITSTMAEGYQNNGRYALAIEYYLKSIEAIKESKNNELLASVYHQMGIAYENMRNNSKASESYAKYLSVVEELNDTSRLYLAYDLMVSPLIALKKYDEARKYLDLAMGETNENNKVYIMARHYDAEGQILRDEEKYREAISYFQKALVEFRKDTHSSSKWGAPFMPLYIAECYLILGEYDKALENAELSLFLSKDLPGGTPLIKSRAYISMSEVFEHLGNHKMAYQYLKMNQEIKDKTDQLEEANQMADAEVRAVIDKSQNEIEKLEREKSLRDQKNKNQRLWILSISGAFLSALLLVLILYRNNRSKQRANQKIEKAYTELKATQAQLIQSEKMASLGELTAGIAHEIQNPLNFVNNFSDLNSELIDELKEELATGNQKAANEIADDIKINEQKISHHGKRAESIVKGMLLHSRGSTGQKELTDINALADEYLRLSYHGFRAKDKSFNADFKLETDESLPKIQVIPQDIGRVLLNLINNAFYACSERSRSAVNEKVKQGINSYKPLVVVKTRKLSNKIEITVMDNGPGIPDTVKEKIFQPFYTTKPTGQGTGLGLSLSYDIVKAHGGELTLESKTKDQTTETASGTSFRIILPTTEKTTE